MNSYDIRSRVLERVLRAISLNRSPGYHFPGNLLELRTDGWLNTVESGPHCIDENGEMDMAFFGVFLDVSMGLGIRKALCHRGRLATLSLSISLTGKPRRGTLASSTEFLGLLEGSSKPQALVRTTVEGAAGPLAYASSTFAVFRGADLFPTDRPDDAPRLSPSDLSPDEQAIYRHADLALARAEAGGEAFPTAFVDWVVTGNDRNFRSRVTSGPHLGNRVGHLQGGLQLGMAARNAAAMLGEEWMLTEIGVNYLRPGEGTTFNIESRQVIRGSSTAVLSSAIYDEKGVAILEAVTRHAARGRSA